MSILTVVHIHKNGEHKKKKEKLQPIIARLPLLLWLLLFKIPPFQLSPQSLSPVEPSLSFPFFPYVFSPLLLSSPPLTKQNV